MKPFEFIAQVSLRPPQKNFSWKPSLYKRRTRRLSSAQGDEGMRTDIGLIYVEGEVRDG